MRDLLSVPPHLFPHPPAAARSSLRTVATWACLALATGPIACDEETSEETSNETSAGTSAGTEGATDETMGGTDVQAATRMHVHPAGDNGVAAAAVLAEDTITLYVCGDADTVQSHTRWFFSLPLGPEGTFEGVDQDWTLTGALTDDTVDAQLLTPDGETLTLGFDPISDGEAPGLYVSSGPGCQTGLVAWDDPSAPGGLGFQGAWCDATGTKEQVIILQPDSFTAEGGQAAPQGREDVEPFTMTPF